MGRCLLSHLLGLLQGEEGRLYLRNPAHGRWGIAAEIRTPSSGGSGPPMGPLARALTRPRSRRATSVWQEAAPPA
ncbi:MAG: hypothetical protein ACE5JL_08860, partial [Dehalococcoidia bacterium]